MLEDEMSKHYRQSLPDTPSAQASNEVAQDVPVQSGQQTDPNSADSEHAFLPGRIPSLAGDGLWRCKYLLNSV